MIPKSFREQNVSRFTEPSTPLGFVYCGEFEPHPQPEDNIAHAEQMRKLTPDDCNGLSVADSQELHNLKGMDALHKADAVAAQQQRATKLRDRLKKDGTANFPKNYQKK